MQIAGFGRSPGDKHEASQMTSMWNDMTNALKKAAPWIEEERKKKIRKRLKRSPRSEIVEADDMPDNVKSALGLS